MKIDVIIAIDLKVIVDVKKMSKLGIKLLCNPKVNVFENKNYEDFIKQQACAICGIRGIDIHHCYHARKNSYLSIPLCRNHHREYHDIEINEFEKKYNIDLKNIIINYLSIYNNEIL